VEVELGLEVHGMLVGAATAPEPFAEICTHMHVVRAQ
jgi:hypothetical protein